MANANLMHILLVVDRSGSMAALKSDTIGGYNEYIRRLREAGDGKERRVTTMLFSSLGTQQVLHKAIPIADVPQLTDGVFNCGGTTALLDAVGQTIDDAGREFDGLPEDEKPGLVQLVVMTDGYENQSCEYTADQVREKIRHQQEHWGWDIVYIGQHAGAWDQAQSMGFLRSNIAQVAGSGAGTQAAFKGLASRNVNYAADQLSVRCCADQSMEASVAAFDASVVQSSGDG